MWKYGFTTHLPSTFFSVKARIADEFNNGKLPTRQDGGERKF